MKQRVAILALAALAGAGCTGPGSTPVVFAAASLTDVFTDLATDFEAATGIDVSVSFAASSSLREQILAGAPADVYAAASRAEMEVVRTNGAVAGNPAVFATNTMVIAVPAGNPARVDGLADLADPGLVIGLCAPEVPCGSLALAILADAGVAPAVDTEEPNVRALLTKISAGELDAGLVYTTDAAAGDVVIVPIPGADRFDTEYLIALLDGAAHTEAATRFIDYVLSDDGRTVLARHGFGAP